MANHSKVRPSRLGRGLSSLMNTPVPVAVPPLSVPVVVDTLPALPTQRSPESEKEASNPHSLTPTTSHEAVTPTTQTHGLEMLHVEQLRPNPYQPRNQFDPQSLDQLAQSIRQDGLMQPIMVRPLPSPLDQVTHELVAGERRWRAARLAGLTHVPCLVRVLTDLQIAEFALIENLQREDLNPLERAKAFAQLMQQFQLSQEEVALRVGIDRSSVSNLIRLLDLPLEIQDWIRRDILSFGQAKALLGVNHPDQQRLLAERAIRGQWSVRQVELAVRQLRDGQMPAGSTTTSRKTAHLEDLASSIGQQLGTKVYLKPGRRKGSGSLTIEFYSLDQFDELMKRMNIQTE